MKKTYIKPQSDMINLFSEGSMLSASNEADKLKYTDTEIDGGDARSNGMGWDSGSWTDEE